MNETQTGLQQIAVANAYDDDAVMKGDVYLNGKQIMMIDHWREPYQVVFADGSAELLNATDKVDFKSWYTTIRELKAALDEAETRIYWLRWDVSCIVQGSPNPYDVLAAEQALKDDDMRAAGRDPFIEALNGGNHD